MARFKDRLAGAAELLPKLENFGNDSNVVILGLLRGGMVPAAFLARKLSLPLDFVIIKKIGAAGDPEFAVGAVSESDKEMNDEVKKRIEIYRRKYPPLDLKNKTAILVDDGVATGTTIVAAIKSAKKRGAREVIVAVPVASTESAKRIKKEGQLIAVEISPTLSSVGEFYDSFPQVEDSEVLQILKNSIR